MKKKQIDEKQLLADAERWFREKHGEFADDCGVEFIQIWYKPTAFTKTTAVVFAPTEEIGKAFIREQNIIFRAMGNFWLVGVAFLVFVCVLIHTLSMQNTSAALTVLGVFLGLCSCAFLVFFYLGRKCKKLEKIHQWDVDVYYPGSEV